MNQFLSWFIITFLHFFFREMNYKISSWQKIFASSNHLVTTSISEAKLSVYSGQMSGGRACDERTMRRLVGPRGTIAVNNACDLCNKRLLHAQPAPRNSMLRNRSASEHRQRTCVLPGYAISGAACTADVTCIRACHYARRATRYRSCIAIFVDAARYTDYSFGQPS